MLVTVGNQLDRSVEESLWRTGQRINKVITSEHWDSEKDVKCKRVRVRVRVGVRVRVCDRVRLVIKPKIGRASCRERV